MTKFLSSSFAFFLLFAAFGCQSTTKTENSNVVVNPAQPAQTPKTSPKSEPTIPVNVPKLAGKSPAELNEIFGAPQKFSSTVNFNEYRLYKIAGQSKGLAVRFERGKAWSFNLILDSPLPTSKEALKRAFNIDVGNFAPVKDAKEPLSEKYQGTFGGVKFKKVSAKKQENAGGFIFVLAEVGE
jgi:hypothetical protein